MFQSRYLYLILRAYDTLGNQLLGPASTLVPIPPVSFKISIGVSEPSTQYPVNVYR